MDLRKLKDQAAHAIDKRSYRKAGDLYVEVAAAEPTNPDWRQRAGDAYRRAGDLARARDHFVDAAEGYAHQGFLLKAIAVCKVVLAVDPHHTATQSMLAELYARRDDPQGRRASDQIDVAPATEIVRTDTGSLAVVPIADRHPGAAMPHARPPSSAPVWQAYAPPDAAAAGEVGVGAGPVAHSPSVTVPLGEALEVVPLKEVLGGRRTREFPAVTPDAFDPSLDAESAAYEIMLDEPAPPLVPAALPQIPLFSSLPADRLRELIERVELVTCVAGELVVRQGDSGSALFVVARGRVQVILDATGAAPARELGTLGEGAFFGELALLTNFPRSATVRALEDSELLVIDREVISRVVADSPEVLRTLMRFFRDRLLARLLASSRLFSLLPDDESRQVADRFVFLELEPRMRVLNEGQRVPGLFLLLCGEAEVARAGQVLARLGPGDLFGEMSLLKGGAAAADIRTVTKCWALELPRERFQEIMLTYPQLLEHVSELAAQRSSENLGAAARVDFL